MAGATLGKRVDEEVVLIDDEDDKKQQEVVELDDVHDGPRSGGKEQETGIDAKSSTDLLNTNMIEDAMLLLPNLPHIDSLDKMVGNDGEQVMGNSVWGSYGAIELGDDDVGPLIDGSEGAGKLDGEFYNEENDDEIQIVDGRRKRQDVVSIDDMEDDIEVVDLGEPLVGRKRRRKQRTEPEIVAIDLDISPKVASNRTFENDVMIVTIVCSLCGKGIDDIRDRTTLTRCKHVLCGACGVKAIVDDTFQQKTFPVCPVHKCSAPLSKNEAEEVLCPLEADEVMRTAYAEVLALENRTLEILGKGHPSLCKMMEPPKNALEGWIFGTDEENTGNNGDSEPWLHDDMKGAFSALYKKKKVRGSNFVIVCMGCGEVVDDSYPMHERPHCVESRALGLRAAIVRLKQSIAAQDEVRASPRKKARQSPIRRNKRSLRAILNASSSKRPSGTGYGGASGGGWKGTSAAAKRKVAKCDARVAFWLGQIRCFILKDCKRGGQQGAFLDRTWPPFVRLLLRENGLTEVLLSILMNDSIMEVGERVGVYLAALRVVSALTDVPCFRVLLKANGPDGRNLAEIVESLSKQAALLNAGAGDEALPRNSLLLVKQVRKNIRGVNRNKLLQANENRMGGSSNPSDNDNCEDTEASQQKLFEEKYSSAMKKLQFAPVVGLQASSTFRNGDTRLGSSSVGGGKAMRRIATEVASLSTTLPLSAGSTILLRVDEERYDYLKACIFGPEGSPYAHGAFIFDIYLPADYPNVPPKFRLLTTGGGSVRFNPNLYACGKVCLSLLGTWSGPGWTKASTLLQVLVSIQSLILVQEPYFNEPGFEGTIGTSAGEKASESYNTSVRLNNMRHAMLGNIQNPPEEFRDAIRTHFKLKRDIIKKDIAQWVEEMEKVRQKPSADTIQPEFGMLMMPSLFTASGMSKFSAKHTSPTECIDKLTRALDAL
eukprot:Plantae.Rhodophyta-Hildenbrandia_rubra.ctg988.p1 GENE.Plantae.Rhodophyta-Hildenbrandia_rubra.ctg988~~Plantae.Rhodophyta-Hildenbrandia_rubra.ctg988.p1  ORF type:complete len:940 (+),score=179.20 Plantae.Rhodophyta-Hildenbrandia_rubra.ctg988:2332-5151(+)